MKILKITSIVIVTIIAFILVVYAYYGGFRNVQFEQVNRGEEVLVYQQMKGDYSQSASAMDSIYYTLLNKYKIETYKGFGIYYDDPDKVAKENLRSDIGCILEKKDYTRMTEISQEFEVRTYESGTFIEAQFPNKGMVSVIIGIMKVYPALEEYMKENGFEQQEGILEIYDTPNEVIVYRVRATKK